MVIESIFYFIGLDGIYEFANRTFRISTVFFGIRSWDWITWKWSDSEETFESVRRGNWYEDSENDSIY